MWNGADTGAPLGPRVIDVQKLDMIHGTTRLRDRHCPAWVKSWVMDGNMPHMIPMR